MLAKPFNFFKGFFKNSLDKALVEFSHNDAKAVEIEKGMMPTAHIVFQDGTHYALKCAKINVKKLANVQEMLSASKKNYLPITLICKKERGSA